MRNRIIAAAIILTAVWESSGPLWTQTDRLPSWNEGATKKTIIDFVARVTTPGAADFVPAEARVATFDNDGTLWTEQPNYFQAMFALDRVKALAPQHPEWKEQQPFKAVLDDDMKALAAGGEKGTLAIIMATQYFGSRISAAQPSWPGDAAESSCIEEIPTVVGARLELRRHKAPASLAARLKPWLGATSIRLSLQRTESLPRAFGLSRRLRSKRDCHRLGPWNTARQAGSYSQQDRLF